MTLPEYLKYLNDMENKGEYEDDDSTYIEEIEEKISELDKFTKENKIKYPIKF